jgi:error-prone DNA polymerase
MSRRGYGNLAQWITVARRRAPKGQYLALMSDVEGKVPERAHAGRPARLPGAAAGAAGAGAEQPFETLFAQALWLKTWFGDRAAWRCRCCTARTTRCWSRSCSAWPRSPAAHRRGGQRADARTLAQAAAGRAHRHAPEAPGGRLRLALEPNAEAHLRSRARLAALYRPEWLEATLVLAGRCASRWTNCATNTRARSCPPATRRPAGCAS